MQPAHKARYLMLAPSAAKLRQGTATVAEVGYLTGALTGRDLEVVDTAGLINGPQSAGGRVTRLAGQVLVLHLPRVVHRVEG
jgi:hypothetical protein